MGSNQKDQEKPKQEKTSPEKSQEKRTDNPNKGPAEYIGQADELGADLTSLPKGLGVPVFIDADLRPAVTVGGPDRELTSLAEATPELGTVASVSL
jgi:hypothetical protein